MIELICLFTGLVMGFTFGWLTHRPKKEKQKEISDEDRKLLDRLEGIKEYVRELQSELNFGYITELQYQTRLAPIIAEVQEMEKLKNADAFDQMMGRPMNFLEEIFGDGYNKKVHQVIGEIDDERTDREGTEKA